MVDVSVYDNDFENKWCPGCGNFGILDAVKSALAALAVPPEKVLLVSGIGQAGKTPHFLNCNFFHGLHGRALPVATGARVANHDLHILVHMGDGDCYGEGGNHLLAALRRNLDVTLLVHDNRVYGLTKGQASPTSDYGFVTRAQPFGMQSDAINPLALALSQGAGFVARGYCGSKDHLSGLIQAAMTYPGFALVNILQVCVSFNHVNTYAYYKERVEYLDPEKHPVDDWHAAMELARGGGEKIPVGLFYRKETIPFTRRVKPLEDGPLVDRAYDRDSVQAVLAKG
jgi:2-oxoglutarate ferredoxin oxidoreductase subunit beta